MIQNIDTDDPFVGEEDLELMRKGLEEIDNFIDLWESRGRENLQGCNQEIKANTVALLQGYMSRNSFSP